MEHLLHHPDELAGYSIPLNHDPPSVEESQHKLLSMINDLFPSSDSLIWVHADEHARMCDREEEEGVFDKYGAEFAKGALETLAFPSNIRVVATYIEVPWAILPQLSSSSSGEVCRVPVAIPFIDINQGIECVPELQIVSSWSSKKYHRELTAEEDRLVAILKYFLMVKVTKLGIIAVHHCRVPGANSDVDQFLVEFQRIVSSVNDNNNSTNLLDILVDCIELCRLLVPLNDIKPDIDAALLLLGINDDDLLQLTSRKITSIVSLPDGRLSVTLDRLLTMDDPNIPMYEKERKLFEMSISAPDMKDLLANSPLKSAYYWTLSCLAAMDGKLRFGCQGMVFNIRGIDLQPGRLFPAGQDNSSIYNLTSLKKHVIYYADNNHPLADLFFLTDEGKLVLVDVSGSSKQSVLNGKKNKALAWMKAFVTKNPSISVHVVLLAPAMDDDNTSEEKDGLSIVSGRVARRLLGGRAQVGVYGVNH